MNFELLTIKVDPWYLYDFGCLLAFEDVHIIGSMNR
jgi:hypothetical protein